MKVIRSNLSLITASLIAILAYSGCAPIPHTICVRNPIELKLLGGGSKYSQILITHEYMDTLCSQPDTIIDAQVAKTIIIKPLFELKLWLVLVPNDPVSGFRICLRNQDTVFFGGHFFHFGYNSDIIHVGCDLMGDKLPPHSPQYHEESICRDLSRFNQIDTVKQDKYEKRKL